MPRSFRYSSCSSNVADTALLTWHQHQQQQQHHALGATTTSAESHFSSVLRRERRSKRPHLLPGPLLAASTRGGGMHGERSPERDDALRLTRPPRLRPQLRVADMTTLARFGDQRKPLCSSAVVWVACKRPLVTHGTPRATRHACRSPAQESVMANLGLLVNNAAVGSSPLQAADAELQPTHQPPSNRPQPRPSLVHANDAVADATFPLRGARLTPRRWIRSGRLPAERVGRQHLVREEDLDALTSPNRAALPRRGHGSTTPRRSMIGTASSATSVVGTERLVVDTRAWPSPRGSAQARGHLASFRLAAPPLLCVGGPLGGARGRLARPDHPIPSRRAVGRGLGPTRQDEHVSRAAPAALLDDAHYGALRWRTRHDNHGRVGAYDDDS